MKYIGVKIVEAVPMTALAAEYKKYKTAEFEDLHPGYEVTYPEGYKSWCPKEVFDEHNRPLNAMTYGMAIECMRLGMAVARRGWNGKDMFICAQIHSNIPGTIVPNMQSLPQMAKDIIMNSELMHRTDTNTLNYENQMLIVNTKTLVANSWVASSSDTFAEDYYVVDAA